MIYLNFKELSSSGRLLSDGESIYDGMRKLFFDTVDELHKKFPPGRPCQTDLPRNRRSFYGSFL